MADSEPFNMLDFFQKNFPVPEGKRLTITDAYFRVWSTDRWVMTHGTLMMDQGESGVYITGCTIELITKEKTLLLEIEESIKGESNG